MESIEKKVIYLPIELKARELFPYLLLALTLIKSDAIVHIGGYNEVLSYIKNKRQKNGALLLKGGMRGEKLKHIKKKLDGVCIFDQEITPIVECRDEIRKRVPKSSLKYIDKIFYLGEFHRGIAREEIPCSPMRPELSVVGWPKLDLYADFAKPLWSKKLETIKGKHGDYLLFSSDFGCISLSNKKEILRKIEIGLECEEEISLPSLEYDLNKRIENFNRCLALLREVDNDPRYPRVIVRPHPGEPKSVWHNNLRHFKKTFVEMDSEITPWILGAKAVLHRGCTSALQAQFAGVPTGCIMTAADGTEHLISCKLSHSVTKASDILELIKKNRLNNYPEWPKNRVSQIVDYSGTERLADELLATVFSRVKIEKAEEASNGNTKTRSTKDAFQRLLKRGVSLEYWRNKAWVRDIDKLLGGIKIEEIKDVLEGLNEQYVETIPIGHNHFVLNRKS